MTQTILLNSETKVTTKVTEKYQVLDIDPDLLWIEVYKIDGEIGKPYFKSKGNGIIKRCTPVFVTDEAFKWLETNCYYQKYEEFDKFEIGAADILADATKIKKENLIWLYTDGAMMFDSDGVPLTKVHMFDYIGTPFRSTRTNIRGLLAYLKEHPWVVNKDELKIEKIPYYNNDSGEEKMISPYVKIRPDQESYVKMYNAAKGKKLFCSSIEDLISGNNVTLSDGYDWLGIREFLRSD
jgi:hypothetical protein